MITQKALMTMVIVHDPDLDALIKSIASERNITPDQVLSEIVRAGIAEVRWQLYRGEITRDELIERCLARSGLVEAVA